MEKLMVGGFIIGGIVGMIAVTAAPIVVGSAILTDCAFDVVDIVKEIKK